MYQLADRERDGNALKALLGDPPCRTCKKDQAGIKVQDYWSGSLDLIIIIIYEFESGLLCLGSKQVKCPSTPLDERVLWTPMAGQDKILYFENFIVQMI